jgi:hypothetical protein
MEQESTFSRKQLGGLLLGGVAGIAASVSPAFAESDMMMPVPMRGEDAFQILKHDHKRLKEHLERIISDPDDRPERLMDFTMHFAVHNATEETFIYPAVGKIALHPDDAEELFHQQDGAKEILWALHEIGTTAGPKSARFTNTTKELLATALAHVHLEETRDYPKLYTALGHERVKRLTHEVREFRRRLT